MNSNEQILVVSPTADEVMQTTTGFNFGVDIPVEDLEGSTKYSVVVIAVDVSGSVGKFRKDLENSLITALEGCQMDRLSDSIIVRILLFADNIEELIPFKEITEIDIDKEIKGKLVIRGCTCLYDVALAGAESLEAYSEDLFENGIMSNATLVIITDGDNTVGTKNTPAMVADTVKRIRFSEKVESIKTIVVAVNEDKYYADIIENFADEMDKDQFIWMKDLTSKGFARLGGFLSSSVSSSAQALGTGSPSKSLNF